MKEPNKHESKYFNTARLMDEALIILLEKKDYEFITVKEICQKAGVNRTTFYLHYETIDDLLRETLEYFSSKFEKSFSNEKVSENLLQTAPPNRLNFINSTYIMPYLRFLKEHPKLYKVAMTHYDLMGAEKYFKHVYSQIVLPILSRFEVPEEEQKYTAAFFTNGLHALVLEWVKGDCAEDETYICGLMEKYICDRHSD